MPTHVNTIPQFRMAVLASGVYALLGGLLTLAGWANNVPELTNWNLFGISMLPNAAVCAVCAGFALILMSARMLDSLIAAIGTFVSLLGAATLIQHVTAVDFGIDRLLWFREWGQHGTTVAGRMGLPASISWMLLGASLVMTTGGSGARQMAIIMALLVSGIAALSMVGYLFGAELLFAFPRYTTIAFQTATMMLAVAVGVVLSLPSHEPLKTFSGKTTASRLARRALPLMVLVPLLLGWLRLHGQEAGFFDLAFGDALRTFVEIVLLIVLAWWALRTFASTEQALMRSQEQLHLALSASRRSEARFRAAVSAVSGLMWTNNAEGQMVEEQPGWANFTGQNFEDYQGYGWSLAVHPEDAEPTIEAWKQTVERRCPFRFEHRLRRHDGQWRVCSIRAVPILGTSQQVVEWVGVHTDITEQRAAEVALRESEQRFRNLADDTPVIIWTADAAANIVYANRMFLDFLGVKDVSEFVGKAWEKQVHPDDVALVHEIYGKAVEEQQPYTMELRIRAAGTGDFEWILFKGVPRFVGGNFAGFIGTGVNIQGMKEALGALRKNEGDLRKAHEAAESASRAKDIFLAQLSHELRTPLTPVLMTAASLSTDDRLPGDVRADLAMIERNVRLESRLIEDLLDLTRITRGKLTLHNELCDAHILIEQTLDMIRDEAKSRHVVVHLELTAERKHLTGDPARLQQVFWNLMRNAVKFSLVGGRVHVGSYNYTEYNGPRFCFVVRDEGIGFASSEAEHLFEPFHQSKSHSLGGLGLGLAIAKAIVRLHHGHIEAQSEGSGRGATFKVEFPVEESTAAGSSISPDATPSGSDGQPLRLLVVEDHEPTRHIVSRLLTRAGHHVTSASCLSEAFSAARAHAFDFVISDLGLPDGTGIELMEQLRELYGLRGIALSGYGMEEDVRRSSQAGFVAHLVKPVNINDLRHALRRVANQAQST